PSLQTSSGLLPVKSWEPSCWLPLSAGNIPDRRLNKDVLPAPLGAISACTPWLATVRSTPLTAFTPPNALATPWHDSVPRPLDSRNFGKKSGSATALRSPIAAPVTCAGRIKDMMRPPTPTRPEGENRMNTMNVSPKYNSQSLVYIDRYSRNRM